jgi:hypothetical protein
MSKYSWRNLRLRQEMKREQIDLLGDGEVVAVISRPERRPHSFRECVPAFAEMIAKDAKGAQCFNKRCTNEFNSVPDAYVFVRTNKSLPPVCSGICPECAKKSDEEILAILRDEFGERRGLAKMPSGTAVAQMPIDPSTVHETDPIDGVRLRIVTEGNPADCAPAVIFTGLLEQRKLRRLLLYHGGGNNCHFITAQIYLDLVEIGMADKFAFKIGNAGVLKSDGEPIGLHSWIEADGWGIDCSGGIVGNPILFQRLEPFYERLQLTHVRNREVSPV